MQAKESTKQPKQVEFTLSTEDFATRNGVKAQSVRARICRFSDYFGIRPRRLANGRLMFPDVQVVK